LQKIAEKEAEAVIPPRKNRKEQREYDRHLYIVYCKKPGKKVPGLRGAPHGSNKVPCRIHMSLRGAISCPFRTLLRRAKGALLATSDFVKAVAPRSRLTKTPV
jgi:hypothetical protein